MLSLLKTREFLLIPFTLPDRQEWRQLILMEFRRLVSAAPSADVIATENAAASAAVAVLERYAAQPQIREVTQQQYKEGVTIFEPTGEIKDFSFVPIQVTRGLVTVVEPRMFGSRMVGLGLPITGAVDV
jgi:hypothetical protein